MKQLLLTVAVCSLLTTHAQKHKDAPRTVKQYTIEQFYKSSNVGGGAFSTDAQKLLLTSNESGIYNAYEINLATGEKTPLTHSTTESIFAQDYVPGTGDIIYSSNKGGNENDHLFLLKSDGSIKELTTGEKEKANFYGWSRDNKAMYYTSNKRDPRFFDLYKMDVATWTPVVLYENDKGLNIGPLSNNEQYVALVESITTSSSNLYLCDLQTKELKKINSEGVEANNNPAQFSVDNQSLYYTTDEGSEYSYAVRYDIPTAKKKKLFSTNWDVLFVNNSYNDKYRVIGVNEDAINKIYLFDNQTGKAIPFPKVEDGDIKYADFSRDEHKMRLYVGDSKSPNNIFVYDFDNGQLKQVTHTLNPEINAGDLVTGRVVRYKSFDGLEIPAILYEPHQASASYKVPAIVMVHGGPGGQARVGYSALTQYLVNHGYAVLDVNNRGSSGYGKTFFNMDNRNHGEKDLMDVVWGKKYLISLPYVDASKIGILGGSYGGFMTLSALTFHPDEFNAGVDLFGVANWLRTLREVPPYWESFKKALYNEIGDPNTDDTIRLKAHSPLLHAEQIKKPLMVLQGANDPRVLKIESDEIVAQVRKNGVPVEYIVFPDEGHGFVKNENEIKGYGAILMFLDKYLKENNSSNSAQPNKKKAL